MERRAIAGRGADRWREDHDSRQGVVESGGGSTNAWSDAGVGNRWSRYSGFDFDGDGIGESAHSLVRPFDRIEASNELARLYLQSPAAAALDLAARGVPGALGASSDAHPLTTTPDARGDGGAWLPAAALLVLLPLLRAYAAVGRKATA